MLDCEGRRGQTQLQEGLGNVEIMKKRAGSGERFFLPFKFYFFYYVIFDIYMNYVYSIHVMRDDKMNTSQH